MEREATTTNQDVLPKRTRGQCRLMKDSHIKSNGTKASGGVGQSKEIEMKDISNNKEILSGEKKGVTKGKSRVNKNVVKKVKEESLEENHGPLGDEPIVDDKKLKSRTKKVKEEISRTNDDNVSDCKEIVSKEKSKATKGKGQVKINASTKRKIAKIKEETIEDNGLLDDEPSSTKLKSKSKKIKEEVVRTATERSIVKKGHAAVDGLCPIANISHVYCEGADIWDCMLNQTNIQFNNNKYYLIQLLKDDNKETYSVWMRWGRVGCTGQNSLKPFASNLQKAKNTFMKKFDDKTKNDWEMKHCFEKVPGKYDLLQMDYSEDTVDNIKKEEEKSLVPHKKVESKLESRVKVLVELICDVRAMEEAVIEMKYDAKKAPLGKLTADQVKAGYAALKQIDDIITENCNASNRSLLEACNAFYTRIPHYFGMKVPPLIRTKAEIQQKISLLQALNDIQAAMSILSKPIGEGIHPADQHYDGLGVDIQSLEKDSAEYKMLEKYLHSTHGSTHTMYKMEIVEIFKVIKSSEIGKFKDYGNRMLLWHGSRLTNFAGILSKGLHIAPPEAPTSGYMFGKGIYFADMSSKSANYCMASTVHDTGLMALCDVSLGKWHTLLNADYNANKLPANHNSVKALGKFAPDPKNQIIISDNVSVPMGPFINTQVNNKGGYTLQYNEYIVYDVNQVQIKYLFKIKFKFN